jgi:1,4-dihydroxy-6-naphthoate synthase
MTTLPASGRSTTITLRLAHSPDPDDAFMWWPLFALRARPPRLDAGWFMFMPVMDDIEALNRRAIAATATGEAEALEITAISCAAYPFVKDRYALTACGSSMGDAYGPKIVARETLSIDDLKKPDVVIAVPGERTTAFAAMSMLLGPNTFRYEVIPFKEIIDAVARGGGRFAAGLIIHEGQLTFDASGLHQIIDLGAWWTQRFNLPLPLGVNAIRRDLDALHGAGTMVEIAGLLRQSVEYALAHREESVAYALQFARDMTSDLADEFIRLYVNKWTLDFGEIGREAVRTFLRETHRAGLTPDAGEVDFVG